MKNNKIFNLILIFWVTLFSFNLRVDAAKELTCIYESKNWNYKITQSSDGVIETYALVTKNGNSRYDSYGGKVVFDTNKYNNNELSGCPDFAGVPVGFKNLYVVDNNKEIKKMGCDVLELISQETQVVKPVYKELTCLYEKKGINNSHSADIYKVLLTQDINGIITLYKNKKDVGFYDYSSYWKEQDTFTLNDSLDIDPVTGGLLSCPKSKTTSKKKVGHVEFFGDSSGEDLLVEEHFELLNFLDESDKTALVAKNDVGYGKSCSSISSNEKWLTEFNSNYYGGSCLYESDTEWGCHIIEVNMSTNVVNVVDSFVKKNLGYYEYLSALDFDTFTPHYIKSSAESVGCPPILDVKISKSIIYDTKVATGKVAYGGRSGGNFYDMIATRGYNVFTGEELKLGDPVLRFEIIDNFDDCGDLFGGNDIFVKGVSTIITIIKIAIPIVLVFLGSFDFIQAVFSGNEDGMKKAKSRFIKRLLIAVCIFFIPGILKLILTIADSIWGGISTDLCGLL